jgi:hypothetical protein
MSMPRTGAEKYFADRVLDADYRAEYEAACDRIQTSDKIASAIGAYDGYSAKSSDRQTGG